MGDNKTSCRHVGFEGVRDRGEDVQRRAGYTAPENWRKIWDDFIEKHVG